MSEPLPKVSAKKYGKPPEPIAAKVRFREKGSGKEGHVYQGQNIVTPCKGCGG